MSDARFADGAERPLRLKALEPDDIPVLSALVQDAVFTVADMAWQPKRRRFSLLVNRFRWEDRAAAESRGRPYERVRAVLVAEDISRVSLMGVDRSEKDTVLSLLSIGWEAGEDGTGAFVLTLAGDGGLRLEAECIDLTLRDVTRPYAAPSGKAPRHPE